MKLTAKDMMEHGLIDGVVKEPVGGAHAHPEEIFATVKSVIVNSLKELKKLKTDKLIEQRIAKFTSMGVVEEME